MFAGTLLCALFLWAGPVLTFTLVFVTHYPVKKADEPFDACNVMFVSYLYAQTNSTRLFFLPQLCGCKSSVALEYPAEIKRVVIPHRHGNILYSQRGIVSNEVGGH